MHIPEYDSTHSCMVYRFHTGQFDQCHSYSIVAWMCPLSLSFLHAYMNQSLIRTLRIIVSVVPLFSPSFCSLILCSLPSLGAGESGKSTIVKQMKILHKDGFTPEWVFNVLLFHMFWANLDTLIIFLCGSCLSLRCISSSSSAGIRKTAHSWSWSSN